MRLKLSRFFSENFFTLKNSITLLLLIGFVIYSNSLNNPFVGDDFGQIINNPLIHSITNAPKLLFGGTFYSDSEKTLGGNYYKPLMPITFSILYSFFGTNSFYYHFLQVILHISNALLIFLLFKQIFHKSLAFILALTFLVHPINSEAVIYISDFQDILFTFFGLTSILSIRADKITTKNLFKINIFLLLSLLSKETGFLFFLILSVYAFLFARKNIRVLIISFSTTLGIYLFMRFISIGFAFYKVKVSPIMYEPLVSRLINLPSIIFFYIKTFFFPKNLIILQNWVVRQVNFSSFILPLLLAILFFLIWIGLGFYIKNKGKRKIKFFILFFLWFLFGLGFHSQIVPLDMTVSERWFYFPEIGLLGLIGLSVSGHKLQGAFKIILIFLVIITLSSLSLRTILRNSNWSSSYFLYNHDLGLDPENYMLHASLGTELSRQQKYDEAEYHLQKAISIFPHFINIQNDLCVNYALRASKKENTEDLNKAEECFKKLIENYDKKSLYLRLIKVLMQKNDYQEAEIYLKEAVSKYPNDAESWYFLAEVEYKLEKFVEAKEAILKSNILLPTKESKDLYLRLIEKN